MKTTDNREDGRCLSVKLFQHGMQWNVKKEDFIMAANVETMFYVRETPWHGLGTNVMEAPCSKDAL